MAKRKKKKKKGLLQKIVGVLTAPGKLPPPPKPLAPPPGIKKLVPPPKPKVKKKVVKEKKRVVTKPIKGKPVTKVVEKVVTRVIEKVVGIPPGDTGVPPVPPPTTYPDPTDELTRYMQEEAWLAEMNRNRPAINKLWNRWERRNIPEKELKLLISGVVGSAPIYEKYERYREYALFDPLASEYYGRSLPAKEMAQVLRKFGSFDMFSSFVDFHRRANSVWLNSPYARAITPDELMMLMKGQLPALPKIEWKVYA